MSTNYELSARPEVRGTADTDGGAYSPSGQSTSYTLTTLSSSKSYGPTGSDGHEWLNDADTG